MNILAIETSCDETAISILSMNSLENNHTGSILSHVVHTQIPIHREFGGVFPALAKRDHIQNIIPVLKKALSDASFLVDKNNKESISSEKQEILKIICDQDEGLYEKVLDFSLTYSIPNIDYIACTNGPGLTPALWVGVNIAKCLSVVWNIPIIPTNHLLGHLLSPFIKDTSINIPDLKKPILGILLSGGHTEITLMNSLSSYTTIGHTLDDAIGEAFDKTARMLGIPYPGGYELDVRAEKKVIKPKILLPRPMLHSGDLQFSFSGLKTAVLYLIKKQDHVSEDFKDALAFELHNSIIDVLLKKLSLAISWHNPETVVVGGGVIANTHIKKALTYFIKEKHPNITLYLPEFTYATDNASMIALAGYANFTDRNEIILPSEIYNDPKECITVFSRIS